MRSFLKGVEVSLAVGGIFFDFPLSKPWDPKNVLRSLLSIVKKSKQNFGDTFRFLFLCLWQLYVNDLECHFKILNYISSLYEWYRDYPNCMVHSDEDKALFIASESCEWCDHFCNVSWWFHLNDLKWLVQLESNLIFAQSSDYFIFIIVLHH